MGIKKEAVIEYLVNGFSYRSLAKKYGVSRSTINKWVLIHQGINDLTRTIDHLIILGNDHYKPFVFLIII